MKHLTDEQVAQVINALETANETLLTVEARVSLVYTAEALALLRNLPDSGEPACWGMPRDGQIYDVICNEEHDRAEGEYTIPLFTAPQPQQCGYDETTGNCTSNTCCRTPQPQQAKEPSWKNADAGLYGPEYQDQQVPREDTEEANDAIRAMLKEYNYPANPQNAGRAGWRAARLYASQPQQNDGGLIFTGGICEQGLPPPQTQQMVSPYVTQEHFDRAFPEAQQPQQVPEELKALLAGIDGLCGSGFLPWQIEDAYSAYVKAAAPEAGK